MQLEEIKKLADLARLSIEDEELEAIAKDFEPILAYVGQVQDALKLEGQNQSNDDNSSWAKLKNVVREDTPTDKPGFYADDIIAEMPQKEGRFLKVKQIL